jgi:hypothetical protein
MRPSTLSTLAAQYSIDVPPVRGFGSFAAFAGMYVAACEVLQAEDDIRRLVAERPSLRVDRIRDDLQGIARTAVIQKRNAL